MHHRNSSYLTGRVDDFRCNILAFVFDDLAEGVLDCRVIALDKVAVDELDGQGGFPLDCCQRNRDMDSIPV